MKKFLSLVIFFLCFGYKICIGEIQTIHHLQEIITEVQSLIKSGINPSTIVVAFDLDDTLIRTYISENFSLEKLRMVPLSAAFLHEYIEKTSQDVECSRRKLSDYKQLTEPMKTEVASFADLRAHDIVLHAQEKGYLKLAVVEKRTEITLGTVDVINQLHLMGVRILAITARTKYMSFMTDRWLQSLGITFDLTQDIQFEKDTDGFCGVYHGGIYTKWNVMNKGEGLTLFFDKTKSWPQVLFIVDDIKRFLSRAEDYFINTKTQGGKITKKYFWYDFKENTPSLFYNAPSPAAEEKGKQVKDFLECMLGTNWVYAQVAHPWLKS